MKKLLFLTILLIPMALYSQEYLPIDTVSKLVTYKEVVEAEGAKEALFDKAKAWAVKAYSSYQRASQLEDRELGKLIVKGMQDVTVSSIRSSRVYYTLTIELKDGRYRATIGDMYGEDKITSSWSEKEMWMYNRLLEMSLEELSSGKLKGEDKEVSEYNLAIYQATIKKINSTMSGVLASLKEAMTAKEEEW